MVEEKTPQATAVSTEDIQKNLKRQLSGTSFLTLEHVGYFVLVVLLPVLLLAGATTAIQLWQNGSTSSAVDQSSMYSMMYSLQPVLRSVDTTAAISITAALLVLVPLMYVLRRRIAAEYGKRPGYTGRVGYKLPVYSALGVLAAMSAGSVVTMLGVFLNSLANIGVSGANIGEMYMQQFLPALLASAVFGLSCWYVGWFAKGKDTSRTFVGTVGVLAAALVIALFVTTLTLNHDTKSSTTSPSQSPDNSFLRY
jgi:hypothetical protein